MRCRYRATRASPPERLLDEFCELTGHERKYATKLLGGRRGPCAGAKGAPSRGGRPPTYDPEVAGRAPRDLEALRAALRQASQTMLVACCRSTRGAMEHSRWSSAMECSPSAPRRSTGSRAAENWGWGGQPANTETQRGDQGACSCAAECWDAREPLERGRHRRPLWRRHGRELLWSLTLTDIFSGWTEVRATWNRGQHGLRRLRGIEAELPSPFSGSIRQWGRVLNRHLHRTSGVGRASGDDPFAALPQDDDQVEQKNSTHVRQLLASSGSGTIWRCRCRGLLEAWSIWRNAFTTTFKQTEKSVSGARRYAAREGAQDPLRTAHRIPGSHQRQGAAAALRLARSPRSLRVEGLDRGRLARIWKLDAPSTTPKVKGKPTWRGGGAVFAGPPPLRSEGPAKTETRPDVLSETIHQTTHPKERYGDPESRLIRRPFGVF